jgi:hypothetical protein
MSDMKNDTATKLTMASIPLLQITLVQAIIAQTAENANSFDGWKYFISAVKIKRATVKQMIE